MQYFQIILFYHLAPLLILLHKLYQLPSFIIFFEPMNLTMVATVMPVVIVLVGVHSQDLLVDIPFPVSLLAGSRNFHFSFPLYCTSYLLNSMLLISFGLIQIPSERSANFQLFSSSKIYTSSKYMSL